MAMLLKMHGEEHKYSGENDNLTINTKFPSIPVTGRHTTRGFDDCFPYNAKGPALDFFYANKIKGYKENRAGLRVN